MSNWTEGSMSSAGDKRRRAGERPRNRSAEPDAADVAVREPGPKFFLAVFQGGFSEAKIFRAYPDADGISFVYAGLPALFIDPELARGARGGWQVKAADALKSGLVKAAVGGLIGLGVVIAIAGRLAARGDGGGATDLIGLALVFLTVFAVGIVFVLTMSVRRIAARVKLLDAMSREEIREETQTDKKSFRATADNVSDVRIDPDENDGQPGCAARLSFRHDPTGKWKLTLVARKDTRLAARAFRALLGEDGVAVNVSLKKE
jgi:hypothetical protein